MSKVLLFDYPSLLDERFLQTDVGQLYQSIPFDALAAMPPFISKAVKAVSRGSM